MSAKTRIIIVSILILLGGALFCYCVFSYPSEITAQAKGDSITVTGSGPAPVEAASIGGVERDKSEQNSQTPSEGRSRPRSGAT